ncbi:relaxase domain-containing protein [Vibrio parahaemolyticus]|nr:relaxase domain-containing protein [Vibrio parahaemolyticus]ELI5422544.1 relaxase domain-containing protein [Vibrio parahaemolyticus]
MFAFAVVSNPHYHIDQTSETYQFVGGEIPGTWAGLGASILGLSGEVEENDFLSLMAGISPKTKDSLYQQNAKKHRPAFDVVFNAPKPVSVIWARANSELRSKIESAHKKAVIDALHFIEENASYTRRGKNGVHHEKVIGVVAALFQHSTSRADDPHLHTHCVIANVAKRLDGTYGSLESMYILKWQKAASYLYKSKLSEHLRNLGFSTYTSNYSFGIQGVPANICHHYSKRRTQILGALEAKQLRTAKAANIVAKFTRGKKKPIDRPELLSSWQSEMDELKFSETMLDKLQLSLGIHLLGENDLTVVSFKHQFLSELLTESVSTFSEIDVYNASIYTAMRLAIPVKAALELAETFLNSELVLELKTTKKYERLFTTPEIREIETQLLKHSLKLSGRNFISGITIEDVIAAQEKTAVVLSEEQQEAVLGVLGNSSLEIMSGSAGAGKSTAMSIVASIYRSKGLNVWGAAIAKAAANNLEQESNIRSFTITKLLIDLDNGWSKVRSGDVIIIDEAGQVGVRQLLKLQEHAISLSFKLILTGEDKQLDAISHGGVLRYLSRPDIIGTTRIETIRRQTKQWDRIAVGKLRDGKAIEALKMYNQKKRLHILQNDSSANSFLIKDWYQFVSNNPSLNSMVLARTWEDVLELNELMRLCLQKAGKVADQDVPVMATVGSRDIDFLLSINDRIRFTRNNSTLGFTNGDTGTVKEIKWDQGGLQSLKIDRDDGQCVTITASSYSNKDGRLYLAPAYAQTIYSAQGQTVNGNVFVLHDPMIDRPHAYVALSRHKHDCHLYVALNRVVDAENLSKDEDIKEQVIKKVSTQFSSEKRANLSLEYSLMGKEHMSGEIEISNTEIESYEHSSTM